MNDFDKIKDKIKKLLALSRSPNPNEAASALKMAQELMAEYKIAQSAVNTFDIGEKTVKTVFRDKPPRYECTLINLISRAFGCKTIFYIKKDACAWVFLGLKHRAEIASFICHVLLRKLRSARSNYLKGLNRVRSKYRKTQRADAFCKGWVHVVTDKLPAFAGVTAEEKKAIELYRDNHHQNLTDIKAINRSSGRGNDFLNGYRTGKGVELQHGVGTFSPCSLMLGS